MTGKLNTPNLMLVTNRHTAKMPLPELAQRAISGGVDVVQIREKDLADDELRSLSASVLEAVAEPSRLMVNGAPGVARRLGIGLHLPEEMAEHFAPEVGGFPRLSRAVHSESTLSGISKFDFAIVGHVFETGGKAGRPPLGLDKLERVVSSLPIDAVAIGGMRPDRVESVVRAGARGIAVLSAINDSHEPEIVAASFRSALEQAMTKTVSELIDIHINGKPVSVPAQTTITGYLAGRGFHERLVVVELNGAILPKKNFSETTLSTGDKVEIVHFVGGG